MRLYPGGRDEAVSESLARPGAAPVSGLQYKPRRAEPSMFHALTWIGEPTSKKQETAPLTIDAPTIMAVVEDRWVSEYTKSSRGVAGTEERQSLAESGAVAGVPRNSGPPPSSTENVTSFFLEEHGVTKQRQQRPPKKKKKKQQQKACSSSDTRQYADSKFERVFHAFGRENSAPVNSGVLYGDYLYTHNVKAHDPAHQKSLQVYPSGLKKQALLRMDPNDELNPLLPLDSGKSAARIAASKRTSQRQQQHRHRKKQPPPPPPTTTEEEEWVLVADACDAPNLPPPPPRRAAGMASEPSANVNELLHVFN